MTKRSEKFEEFFFNELYQAVEATLERLSEEEGWRINSYKDGKTRYWVIQAVPDFSFTKINLLPKASRKKLKINLSGQVITTTCEENWPSLAFDFLNQKKRIINKFFKELESVIKEDFGQ